ncbi:MAG: alpha/beta family hydrolase [Alphaproteobacteria bacterium]
MLAPRSDTSPHFLFDGPEVAPVMVVLAHGAGAPMDSAFMNTVAKGLAEAGNGRWRVARFEFPYMTARRKDGRRRPPDRQAQLLESWRSAIASLDAETIVIGGKSMGGRMASLVADECKVRGLLCLSYPFHPPRRPGRLRTAHLADLTTRTLVVQGTHDPLGSAPEVAAYALSPRIHVHWIEDGDHDLVPRKRSGRDKDITWREATDAAAEFLTDLEAAP